MAIDYHGTVTAHKRKGGGTQYSVLIDTEPGKLRVTMWFIDPIQLEKRLKRLFPDRDVHVAYERDQVLWIDWAPSGNEAKNKILGLVRRMYSSGGQRLEGYERHPGKGTVKWTTATV